MFVLILIKKQVFLPIANQNINKMVNTIEYEGVKIPSDLNRNGLELHGDNLTKAPFNMELIARIRNVIRTCFTPTSRVRINSGSHSYTLKHRIEKNIGVYCSNGDVIYAMIAEGYKFKRLENNCCFNVDPSSTRLSILRE